MLRDVFTAILLPRVVANLAAVSSCILQRRSGFAFSVLVGTPAPLVPFSVVAAAAAAYTVVGFCSSGRRSRKRSPAVAAQIARRATTSWCSSHTLLGNKRNTAAAIVLEPHSIVIFRPGRVDTAGEASSTGRCREERGGRGRMSRQTLLAPLVACRCLRNISCQNIPVTLSPSTAQRTGVNRVHRTSCRKQGTNQVAPSNIGDCQGGDGHIHVYGC